MTHYDKRIYLIRTLLTENPVYRAFGMPPDEQGQKDLLRALMNIRDPLPIGIEFQQIQDEYLREEIALSGIVDVNTIPATMRSDHVFIWQGDITTLRVDAIVNSANSGMCGCFRPLHNCIDNRIHSRAGIELRLRCFELMQRQGSKEKTGLAKLTPAYNLPCKYILHTVGPIVDGRLTKRHRDALRACYISCLRMADTVKLKSLAFCCISTGNYGFPSKKAAEIAVKTVLEYLDGDTELEQIVFCVYTDSDRKIYENLLR